MEDGGGRMRGGPGGGALGLGLEKKGEFEIRKSKSQ